MPAFMCPDHPAVDCTVQPTDFGAFESTDWTAVSTAFEFPYFSAHFQSHNTTQYHAVHSAIAATFWTAVGSSFGPAFSAAHVSTLRFSHIATISTPFGSAVCSAQLSAVLQTLHAAQRLSLEPAEQRSQLPAVVSAVELSFESAISKAKCPAVGAAVVPADSSAVDFTDKPAVWFAHHTAYCVAH